MLNGATPAWPECRDAFPDVDQRLKRSGSSTSGVRRARSLRGTLLSIFPRQIHLIFQRPLTTRRCWRPPISAWFFPPVLKVEQAESRQVRTSARIQSGSPGHSIEQAVEGSRLSLT